MNLFVICSALNNSYLGFEFNNKIITEIIKSDENYHSLYLPTKIKEIAAKENIDFKKLTAIAVNTGHGSFTGIRVAMSIAKTIAGELNLPLIPLNSAEILLRAFNKDVLITDARRDMYFYSTKEGTELIYKDKLDNFSINENTLLVDKRCEELFKNALCFEDNDLDLAKVMLEIAKEKYNNSKNLAEFNYLAIEANYIQTPPIF